MNCDKCYHNEVCSALYEMNGVPRIGATECAYFKDKARVVEVVRCKECANRLIDDLASKIKRHFAGDSAVYTNTNYYVRSVVDRYAEEMKRGAVVRADELKLSSELKEQIAVVDYCTLRGIDIVHIPNEGKRSVVAGAMLKRAGMRPGFPDLFLPRPRGKYHGLFIEMKYDKGKTTADQEWWLATLSREGYAVRVCYGFDEAVRCIEAYLRKGVYQQ